MTSTRTHEPGRLFASVDLSRAGANGGPLRAELPALRTARARLLALFALIAIVTITACAQTPPPPHGWTMVAHVKAGLTPGPITLAGKWAFVPNMDAGTVTQIDRASGKVVATITVADPAVLRSQGCAPDSVHAYYSGSWGWRLCDTPYAIAWDGTMLWAIDNGRKQLVQVDPVLHRATGAVDLPGMAWDVAAAGATAWVSGWLDNSVYVVDLRARRIATVISDLDAGPSSLAIGAGALWIVCARGATGHLDRIDLSSNKVVGRFEIEWWSNAVIAVGGAVFVRGTNGGDLTRLNLATGAAEWTKPGPAFIGRHGIDQIAATADGIWLSGPFTSRVDPATGEIAGTIRVGSASVASDGTELWLVQLDGSVSEFKLQ